MVCHTYLTLVILSVWALTCSCHDDKHVLDLLLPYIGHHGPQHRGHREVRDCQHIKYGNRTHSKHKARDFLGLGSLVLPLVESRHQLKEIKNYYTSRISTVSFETVNNPLLTFSVLEPQTSGTCKNGSAVRATVRESTKQRNCILATNAGFFDLNTGACLGNIVSDGKLVQDSGGIQNAHFGLTHDGYIYVGYLSELDLLTQKFSQLVGGVLWLVREGEPYVDESIKIECSDTETTGTMERFAKVRSARMAVGHDKDGRILIAKVDGKTGDFGVDLYEFSSILRDLGFVNAINLDGGGSTTTVINGTIVGHPSDVCLDKRFNCERAVSTILCVHRPDCHPADCSGHGECRLGVCHCSHFWAGVSCDSLSCPGRCSGHGKCTSGGCVCVDGWHGSNCSETCPEGKYGYNCSMTCCCGNGGHCDSVTGRCDCAPGFAGEYCQSVCPYGFYGNMCTSMCSCDTSCFCHHVTGSCNSTNQKEADIHHNFIEAGNCIAEERIRTQKLVPDQSNQYKLCVTSSIVLSIIAAISVIINISICCIYLAARQRHATHTDEVVKKTIRKFIFHNSPDYSATDSEGSDEVVNMYSARQQKGLLVSS